MIVADIASEEEGRERHDTFLLVDCGRTRKSVLHRDFHRGQLMKRRLDRFGVDLAGSLSGSR
jgi:hypothetical protein